MRYFVSVDSGSIFDRVIRVQFVETKPSSLTPLGNFKKLALVELEGIPQSAKTQQLIQEMQQLGADVVSKQEFGGNRRYFADFSKH